MRNRASIPGRASRRPPWQPGRPGARSRHRADSASRRRRGRRGRRKPTVPGITIHRRIGDLDEHGVARSRRPATMVGTATAPPPKSAGARSTRYRPRRTTRRVAERATDDPGASHMPPARPPRCREPDARDRAAATRERQRALCARPRDMSNRCSRTSTERFREIGASRARPG